MISHWFRLLRFLLVLILAMSTACLKSPSEPASQEPATITLSSYSVVLTSIGQRIRIDATVLAQDGKVFTDATIFWRSSSDDIATVSDQGIVTAVSSGTTQINVTSGYATATATISVMQETGSIEIAPSSVILSEMGETIQLELTVYDINDDVIVGATATWSSSDPAVASVDTNGLVTAVDNGSTKITATADSVSGSATLSVKIVEGNRMIDREALIAFYNATGGPNWTNNTDWLNSTPPEIWHGVTTENIHDRVTEVDLIENNLAGVIPPEIGNLGAIEVLRLSNNQLTGEIPSETSNLSALQVLELGWNQLSGEIPHNIGNLGRLENLDLAINQLSGEVPPEIGNLERLEVLRLSSNELSGEIPPEIGNLKALEILGLYRNMLSGEIPSEIGNLESLETLVLSSNLLSGEIPPEIGNLKTLRDLGLNYNQLSGEIPTEIGSMRALEEIRLSDNHLSGEIPTTIGSLSKLDVLDVSDNQLSGEIPIGIDNLKLLGVLRLSRNQLSGEIPPEIGNMGFVFIIRLDGNQLSGKIPPEIGNLRYLRHLSLNDNRLSGKIPPEMGNMSKLETLDLADNLLTGEIPREIAQLMNLVVLNLSNNENLSGTLPIELTTISSLSYLYLRGTQVCAPASDLFDEWLDGLSDVSVDRCPP